ncbi:MAG TPA: hypothetical protein VF692_12200 [Pyrinomonadaceae bacterium]|jgi:hypothetical protein
MNLKQSLSTTLLFLFAAGFASSAFSQQPQKEKITDRWDITRNADSNQSNTGAVPKLVPIPPKPNAVCPDPSKPCHHREKQFDEWELSFRMPARLKANKGYESAPFYAVILKTYETDEDCDGGEYIEAIERDRKKEQKNQPTRKVFASYNCPNMAAVGYNFDGRWSADGEEMLITYFIAVYAGETKQEGEAALRRLKSAYPKAMLKQMKATYEKIEQ